MKRLMGMMGIMGGMVMMGCARKAATEYRSFEWTPPEQGWQLVVKFSKQDCNDDVERSRFLDSVLESIHRHGWTYVGSVGKSVIVEGPKNGWSFYIWPEKNPEDPYWTNNPPGKSR
jgi:hypothetical protein